MTRYFNQEDVMQLCLSGGPGEVDIIKSFLWLAEQVSFTEGVEWTAAVPGEDGLKFPLEHLFLIFGRQDRRLKLNDDVLVECRFEKFTVVDVQGSYHISRPTHRVPVFSLTAAGVALAKRIQMENSVQEQQARDTEIKKKMGSTIHRLLALTEKFSGPYYFFGVFATLLAVITWFKHS